MAENMADAKRRSQKADYKKRSLASGIKKGDMVRVLRQAKYLERGWPLSWAFTMDELIGRCSIVKEVRSDGAITLENNYSYPFFVLEKVKSMQNKPQAKNAEPRIKLLNDNFVTIEKEE